MVTASALLLKVMRGSSGPWGGLTTNEEEGATLQSKVGGYRSPEGGAAQDWINWRPESQRDKILQSVIDIFPVLTGVGTDLCPLLLSLLYSRVHQQPTFIAVQGHTLHPCHTEPEACHHTLQYTLLHVQYPVNLGRGWRGVKGIRKVWQDDVRHSPSFDCVTHFSFRLEGSLYYFIHSAVDVCWIKYDEGTCGSDTYRQRNGNAHPCCVFTKCNTILWERRSTAVVIRPKISQG